MTGFAGRFNTTTLLALVAIIITAGALWLTGKV